MQPAQCRKIPVFAKTARIVDPTRVARESARTAAMIVGKLSATMAAAVQERARPAAPTYSRTYAGLG